MVFEVKSNEIGNCSCGLLFALRDDLLDRIIENAKSAFILKDIIVVEINEGSACIKGEVVIVVETPFGQLCKLLEGSVWIFKYL